MNTTGNGVIGKEATLSLGDKLVDGKWTPCTVRVRVESFDSFFRDGVVTSYLVRRLDNNESRWVDYTLVELDG